MAAAAAATLPSLIHGKNRLPVGLQTTTSRTANVRLNNNSSNEKTVITKCSRDLGDFIRGDLVKLDLGQWLSDVEEHKALAIYSPHEGGYEGRYLNRLVYKGYNFLDLSARGLGDPETTLTKIQAVCPAELQFLAILPSLRPRVRVIAECGNWRKFMWKPLKEIAGLPATMDEQASKQ